VSLHASAWLETVVTTHKLAETAKKIVTNSKVRQIMTALSGKENSPIFVHSAE